MEYLIIGRDGTDEKALERRMENRPAHLVGMKALKASGNIILAGAMLNEAGNMAGSAVIMRFDTPEELEKWLSEEPYIQGKVWEFYEVHPLKIADL